VPERLVRNQIRMNAVTPLRRYQTLHAHQRLYCRIQHVRAINPLATMMRVCRTSSEMAACSKTFSRGNREAARIR
jgi:hypothetical protein